MSDVLVLYHSYDEQTARIARRIGDVIAADRHAVTLQRFNGPGALDGIARYDAIVVGAAIRYGHHDRELEKEVAKHAAHLAAMPNAFFSVCLSAGGPGCKPEAARHYIEAFCRKTGWKPREVTSLAGALQYRKYGAFNRFMMKLIVGHAGGDTDTSRDYEYTDWAAVERFAQAFVQRLTPSVVLAD